MTGTSKLQRYAVVYGRFVEFFARPAPLGVKRYREPVKVGSRWFKNKESALRAVREWEAA